LFHRILLIDLQTPDNYVSTNCLPKTSHELAKEPVEFFIGMFDGLLSSGTRREMTGNPMYLAGRRESTFYEPLEGHDVETVRTLKMFLKLNWMTKTFLSRIDTSSMFIKEGYHVFIIKNC
jgi:hypothetical protein